MQRRGFLAALSAVVVGFVTGRAHAVPTFTLADIYPSTVQHIHHTAYSVGFKITEEVMEDDLYGAVIASSV